MLPTPVSSQHACSNCGGTGADAVKTAAARKAGHIDRRSYISCWHCNGNGLDPAAFFRWSAPNQSGTST